MRCPVCGKNTVCIIDQAGDLPVTLCLACDTRQMIADMGLSRWEVWRLHARVWLNRMVSTGLAGVLLCLVVLGCFLATGWLPAGQEDLRAAAAWVVSLALMMLFFLYIAPLGLRRM